MPLTAVQLDSASRLVPLMERLISYGDVSPELVSEIEGILLSSFGGCLQNLLRRDLLTGFDAALAKATIQDLGLSRSSVYLP